MHQHKFSAWSLSFVALIGLAGCGKVEIDTLPVQGNVFMDGKPLAHGSVVFLPDKSRGNNSLYGAEGFIVNERGEYKVYTLARDQYSIARVFAARKSGAAPGWYKVIVSSLEPYDPAKHAATNPNRVDPKWLTLARYRDISKTPLEVKIVERPQPGAYDLKLSSR